MKRLMVYLGLVVCAMVSARVHAAQVTRLIKVIDFEERRLGNDEAVPMHFSQVQGPDLPHYLSGTITGERANSGKYSFRFDLDGGSLVYRYDAEQLPVSAGAHYRIDAMVSTTALEHARARISAGFADKYKHLIADSMRHSELYAAGSESDAWKELSVEVSSADEPKAAYLVVQLELLQPVKYLHVTDEKARGLLPQDLKGSAWFDDVKVWQVPKVRLSSERPGNIFRRGQALRLTGTIEDRITEDLTAQFALKDDKGATLFQRNQGVGSALASGKAERKILLDMPEDVPAGRYRATLNLISAGMKVAERSAAIVVLPDDDRASTPDTRLGVIATDVPSEKFDELAEILPVIDAGSAKILVPAKVAEFDALVDKLLEKEILPTACLNPEEGSWAQLGSLKPEDWKPQLTDLIARHANHVPRWQIGLDGTDTFANDPATREAAGMLYKQIATMIREPAVVVPWPASSEIDAKMPTTVALGVPASVLPNQVGMYVQELQQARKAPATAPSKALPAQASISLELLDFNQHGREAQIRDLALRVIHAVAAKADHVDLPLPVENDRDGQLQPSELFLPTRTLCRVLGNANFKGAVPVAEGVDAMLFERDGMGILAIWTTNGLSTSPRQLELDPGPHPRLVDMFGNTTPLLVTNESRETGKVRLSLGALPVFIVDVDGPLAQLRATVALDRPMIESSYQAHSRRLHFTNPYQQAISGTVKLSTPAGWTVIPSSMSFSLNPGETFDKEFSIEFPYNATSGNKFLEARFNFMADKQVTFAAPLLVKLGLSEVGMQSVAFREGRDVIVQQVINNYSDKPIDYTAFAMYPDQARQERLVMKLGAGQSVIKRYRFRDAKVLQGTRVRVGLRELSGGRLLNDELIVH